ncbi:ArsR/SmtB family transcription factor [Microbacterium sp. NPDC003461]
MIHHELPVAQLKAELFKALAHPLRVRALEQLVRGERAVGALADLLDVELGQLSSQLGVLRRAGVVVTRREGTTILYSVRDPLMADLLGIGRRMLVENLRDSRALLDDLENAPSTADASPRDDDARRTGSAR